MDPLTITLVLVALAAAILAVWTLSRAGVAQRALVDADRRAADAEARAAGTEAELRLANARLEDQDATKRAFEALANESLRAAQRDLVETSKAVLESQQKASKSELDARRTQIDALIAPMREALERTKRELTKQGERSDTLEGVLKEMRSAQGDLRKQTHQLAEALRRPNVRGRYGEIQLQRVVELAGMREYCDFETQSVLDGGESVQRPDLVVRLPNGRSVVVDAKVPIDDYMDAANTNDEAAQDRALAAYGKAVLLQVKRLGRKEYWKNFQPAPEFVVMFLPGDQFVDAALKAEPRLIDEAAGSNVLLASPSTLIGLLRAVHVGWRERSLTESAQELFALGSELHDRATGVLRHAADFGVHLQRTLGSYNKFVGSVERRLLPTLRKFEEKGAHSQKKLAAPVEVEDSIRPFRADLELAPAPRSGGAQAPDDDQDDGADPEEHQAQAGGLEDGDRDAEGR